MEEYFFGKVIDRIHIRIRPAAYYDILAEGPGRVSFRK